MPTNYWYWNKKITLPIYFCVCLAVYLVKGNWDLVCGLLAFFVVL